MFETGNTLVLFQHDNCGFSVPVVFRSKVQCEGNGVPLSSTARRMRDTTGTPLRVGLSTPTDSVASLAKGVAIVCETRLAVNVGKPTEIAIIMLKDH